MGQLYKLDFPNGKSYIGITTKTAAERLKTHGRDAPREKPGGGPALYRAWRKHGAPTLTVLAIVDDAYLCETERRAIAVFGTLSPGGYNLTVGGESSPAKHPEVRAKMSAAAKGRKKPPRTAETRAKLSAAQRARAPASAETRAKMSAAQRARAPASAETRAKMSAVRRGRKASPERVAKIAAAHRGMKRTPEALANMRAAQRARREADKLLEFGIV